MADDEPLDDVDDEPLDVYIDRLAREIYEHIELELNREAADPAGALELVNAAREARGQDPLGTLPVDGSVRGSISRCVVARALECEVTVSPSDSTRCSIWLGFPEDAEAVGALPGYERRPGGSTCVDLPAALSLLTVGFDFGLLEPDDLRIPCDPAQLALPVPEIAALGAPEPYTFVPEAWREHSHGGWWPVEDPRMTLNLLLIGVTVVA